MKEPSLNIFGASLVVCGTNPLTGAYRNGCCDTGPLDVGTHIVCAVVSDAFLAFSKSKGNDLTRPYPLYNFPGLVAGDHWCLCVFDAQCCKTIGFVMFSLHNVEKTLVFLSFGAEILKKCWFSCFLDLKC